MKLEDQVCSLELANRLKELGIKQHSICYWWQYDKDSWHLTIAVYPTSPKNYISAFTVAELGEMLPSWINGHHLIITKASTWFLRYRAPSSFIPKEEDPEIEDENEANARAKMLIYLIENALIKIKEQ